MSEPIAQAGYLNYPDGAPYPVAWVLAMKVINVSQRSDAWRQWRAQGVSASEAAVIMNRSPYKTPWRLWAEKTGLVLEQDFSNNPLNPRGIQQEPVALQHFEDKHGVLLLPLCGESNRYPLMRASFDGLSEGNEPVEIKCPHEPPIWMCS